MRSLLRFIIRFHFFILFLIIESFSIFLVIQYNNYQKSSFINSANKISGTIFDKFSVINDYFNLRIANSELSQQNALLLNRSKNAYKSNQVRLVEIFDSIYFQQYDYRVAKVINNSVNKQSNYLTLNKGSLHGIKPETAVVGPNGIVGIVRNVSANFSTVISILNVNLKISGKIKKNNYYGSVSWDGTSYSKVTLYEIPNHVEVTIGDTVITSGYSVIFPEGILIGTVSEVNQKVGGNFHVITLDLSENFKNLSYVYVIDNWLKKEQIELESTNN